MAREQMREGNFALADQMLSSFWSNFLSTYLPADSSAAQVEAAKLNEARLPLRTAPTGPAWRKPGSPRVNHGKKACAIAGNASPDLGYLLSK